VPEALDRSGGGIRRSRGGARRALFVNLDFQDFIYSWFFAQRIVAGCRQRGFVVDLLQVDPKTNRDLASELGPSGSTTMPETGGSTRMVTEADLTRVRGWLDEWLARYPYDTLILNCDASLLADLLRRHDGALRGARWLIYDRHLHEGLGELAAPDVRSRLAAHRMHLFALREIAKGARFVQTGAAGTEVLTELRGAGFRAEAIHLPLWPLDDDFFAPAAEEQSGEFTIFSGGDSGRDYASLFEAVRGLPVRVRLATGSSPSPVPESVTILPRLHLFEFRDEVRRASAVVVPLTGSPPVSGITVLAMARMAGRPVIATDLAAVRLHIPSTGDGGWLVPARDAGALRFLIDRLIREPDTRVSLGESGRTRASRECSLRKLVDEMLSCDDVPRA
jgi:hypothetical protein